MKKTIYLLTGAAGLLGSNISRELVAEGKQVRALVLNGDPAAKYVPEEVEIVFGDLVDTQSLEKFFAVPADTDVIVIHCASIVTTTPEPSQKIYNVNVNGTKNIVDLCVAKKVKKLVYISSTGAIAEEPNGQTIREPKEFFPDQVAGYYSKTKALATQYVLETVHSKGLDACVVYPSGICGPNDYTFGPVIGFVIRYCNGQMPVGVEGSFNSVDARDLAKAIVTCTEKGRKGEGYIMGNEMVSMRRMFDLISDVSGCSRVETILTAEQMLSMSGESFAGEEGKSKEAALKFEIYNLMRNNNFSSEKAEKELGYQTRPFEETMRDIVDWLSGEGKISSRKVAANLGNR